MSKKRKDLETLRSDYKASLEAYKQAENERIEDFTKLLFSDEELRQLVLNYKTSSLKQNAKMWADTLKKLSPANAQQKGAKLL